LTIRSTLEFARRLGRSKPATSPTVDENIENSPETADEIVATVDRDGLAPVDEMSIGDVSIGDVPVEMGRVEQAQESGQDAALAEEATLVQQAKRDPAAFGVLYERYVDRIYAYIFHRVGNSQDAEDLTARTFYRALDNLENYEERGLPFAAWLFRIAHNLVANWHRDGSKRSFLSLDRFLGHSRDNDRPEIAVEQEERNNALLAAINRLPEERRNLVLFKFGSQLSNLEIGELMNKSESAIKSLYFRTLATLRRDLEARGWGVSGSGITSSSESSSSESSSEQVNDDE
jgi:RNA polymerase sigma-70 factor (ECF subfamily)